MKAALKLIETTAFYRKEIDLCSGDAAREGHSLHYVVSCPEPFPVEVPAYFVDRFSKRGDVVLDPFCGTGITPLEAALRGRVPYASDVNSLAVRISAAKLTPVDISEVTLALQRLNLRRPIDLKLYHEHFAPFYDIETFREVVNLRAAIHATRASGRGEDRAARFIELLALGLLHGHSAGYFSAYTFPQVSLTPSEQQALNDKRHQTPDYRAVVPRVLRKAASALRDGCPSVLRSVERDARVVTADPRNLHHIASGSVDLTVTAPPIPGMRPRLRDMWLRLWFAGISGGEIHEPTFDVEDLSSWLDYMNEVLFELARVTRSRGRVVLDLAQLKVRGKAHPLDEDLLSLVDGPLARFWDAEGVLTYRRRTVKVRGEDRSESLRSSLQNQVVVLRRR